MSPLDGGTESRVEQQRIGYAEAVYSCGCVIRDRHHVPMVCPKHGNGFNSWQTPDMPIDSTGCGVIR